MVFIEVSSVVMLTTGKTPTTWMLAVLSYTTMTGGNVAAAEDSQLARLLKSNNCPNRNLRQRLASELGSKEKIQAVPQV